jgi:hypothetical protein
MKKFFICTLAGLLVIAVIAAGCGGKSKTAKPSSKAQDVLARNQKKMQDVKSLKMTGKATVLTPQSETKEESVTYQGEMAMVGNNEVEMHMVVTESSGEKSEVYVVGGYVYNFDPARGWTKQKVAAGSAEANLMTPTGISGLSKYAENMKLGASSGAKYVLTFGVGSRLFEQIFEQATDSSSSTAPSSKAEQQLMESMKDMFKGLKMDVVYKIDKNTMLADSASVTMSMKGAPIIGDMSLDMTVTFTDYNVPVSITLPPEAQNAPEVEPSASGVPSIPSIPGLGL